MFGKSLVQKAMALFNPYSDDKVMKNLLKHHEIFEPTSTGWKTREGRHPLESKSKYTGNGALRKR